jgi:diguanylate cyclase (GGDEF)-like protein
MKIGETHPVTGTTPTREQAARDGVTAPERAGRAVRDSASVMGIPSEEVTPRVQAAVMTLMAEVDRLKRELENNRKRMREVEDMADQDPLLPVLNRRAFERELARAQSYIKRYGGRASLVYIDLDNFKQINDEHSHAAGDAVLRLVAELLLDSVRQSDVVGRVGGDEFAVVLMQSDMEQALRKAQSLLGELRAASIDYGGHTIALSASAGVASIDEAVDPASAMVRADLAMYEDKASRRV